MKVMEVITPQERKKKGQHFQHARVLFQHVKSDFHPHSVISTHTSVILITTRSSVIYPRRVYFIHAECNFKTNERDFNTHKIDFYTKIKISTRRVCFLYTREYACKYDTHGCDFYTKSVTSARTSVISIRTIFNPILTQENDFQRRE
jgi:hypothetical protein